eukprot:Gb_25692 [translate_table: standard]
MHKAIWKGFLWKIISCAEFSSESKRVNAPTRRYLLKNIPDNCSCKAGSHTPIRFLCDFSKQNTRATAPKQADGHICSTMTKPSTPFRSRILPNGHSVDRGWNHVLLIRRRALSIGHGAL